MKHAYLFDVDGVLCEPQQKMNEEVQRRLESFCCPVFFVTGNSYTKAMDMLGLWCGDWWSGVFCNNADELRESGQLIWQDTETPPLPSGLARALLFAAYWNEPAANQTEWRNPRFVNFCPIGRYANKEQRDAHDPSWRRGFISKTLDDFDVECVIGGQVSVDIYSKGADKSRAGKWLNDNGYTFAFIGDKTDPGGNDYPLVKYCEAHPENKWYKSTGPEDTLRILREIV